MLRIKVPEWCCAIRFNDSDETSLLNNSENKFYVLKDSYRYWTADPFLFKKYGKYYLFFEMFDRLKRKGLLGYREISNKGIGKLNVIYECDCHLSYPYIYEKNGNVYIIPESSDSRTLFRLKCVNFPDVWEKETVLANDRLVDTTLFQFDDVDYYLSERVCQDYVFDRFDLFYTDEFGQFLECKNNPMKVDANTSRCAGKVFSYKGNFIRPSQNCGKFYGEKLNFNKIVEISKESYKEECIKTISVNDISLDSNNNFVGIHTYNKLDNIEVIDLKISRFNILNVIGAIVKRLF